LLAQSKRWPRRLIDSGECFVASDIPAILSYTKDMIFLDDGDQLVTEHVVRLGQRP